MTDPGEFTKPIKVLGLLMFGCLVLLFLFVMHQHELEWLLLFTDYVESLGYLGCLIFVCLDSFMVVLMIPALPMTLSAGAIWDIWLGTLVSCMGKWFGAMMAFGMGRFLLAPCVLMLIDSPRVNDIRAALTSAGWKMSFLLRLSPLMPYNVLNYTMACTDISFFTYSWTALLGMIPGTFAIVYTGARTEDLLETVNRKGEWIAEDIIALTFGLILSAGTVFLTQRIVRAEMNRILEARGLPE